jgi:hypothetical protein
MLCDAERCGVLPGQSFGKHDALIAAIHFSQSPGSTTRVQSSSNCCRVKGSASSAPPVAATQFPVFTEDEDEDEEEYKSKSRTAQPGNGLSVPCYVRIWIVFSITWSLDLSTGGEMQHPSSRIKDEGGCLYGHAVAKMTHHHTTITIATTNTTTTTPSFGALVRL